MTHLKRLQLIVGAVIVLTLFAACGADTSDGDEATKAAILAQVAQTAEAEKAAPPADPPVADTPVPEAPADTPVPAEAPTDTPVPAEAPTPEPPTATAETPNLVSAEDEAFLSRLAIYGVDRNAGLIQWAHPTFVLEAKGFHEYNIRNNFLLSQGSIHDFVVSADIKWNTQYGTTGCGFVLRTDGKEENPSQYVSIITRGGNGRAEFVPVVKGEIDDDNITDIYAGSSIIDWQNDSTNNMTVVGRGDNFTIFANGVELGTVNGGYNYLEGLIAFLAVNESGNQGTSCEFSNGYLFVMQ